MSKDSIIVQLDSKAKEVLEKRAKKEMLSLSELVAEILRRSVISYKKKGGSISDKLDDKFIGYFSRKNRS